MVALLVFIMATLEIGQKKCWTQKGPFGDNVYKDPARYLCMALYPYVKLMYPYVKLWLYLFSLREATDMMVPTRRGRGVCARTLGYTRYPPKKGRKSPKRSLK